MIRDTYSNSGLSVGLAPATVTVGTAMSASADHSLANSATFIINIGVTTGTVNAKLQHSADDSAWVDDDGASGNIATITEATAAGMAAIHCFNPQERYSRILVTVGGTSSLFGISIVQNPLRTIVPTDA